MTQEKIHRQAVFAASRSLDPRVECLTAAIKFTGLATRRLPEARAEFFLDPWNSPYWIRDRCDKKKGRRVVFVYSFGPNRSRDSSRWEILGDDIGEYVLVEPR